jgi:hypothetical protein
MMANAMPNIIINPYNSFNLNLYSFTN